MADIWHRIRLLRGRLSLQDQLQRIKAIEANGCVNDQYNSLPSNMCKQDGTGDLMLFLAKLYVSIGFVFQASRTKSAECGSRAAQLSSMSMASASSWESVRCASMSSWPGISSIGSTTSGEEARKGTRTLVSSTPLAAERAAGSRKLLHRDRPAAAGAAEAGSLASPDVSDRLITRGRLGKVGWIHWLVCSYKAVYLVFKSCLSQIGLGMVRQRYSRLRSS